MTRKTPIYEPDEIKAVFTFLKTEKTITNITESSGISTIYSDSLVLLNEKEPIYLQAGQIVTLDGINYQVLTVNLKTNIFTITATGLYHMSTDPIPVKVLDVTKWNLAVNFKFGSRIEINELLALEANNPDAKLQRFPLVWLFINDTREHDNFDYDFKTNIKMAFVHTSDKESRAQARLDNVIKKVVHPLKVLFLETIQSAYFNKVFNFEFGQLTYNDYIRYFYGSSDKNQMVLDAPTDAIEIDLDVIFQNQYN